jgi:hypothetical protein
VLVAGWFGSPATAATVGVEPVDVLFERDSTRRVNPDPALVAREPRPPVRAEIHGSVVA